MANVWRLLMLMIGVIFTGRDQVCCAGDLEEVNQRLLALEAGKDRLQASLQSLQETHSREINDALEFARDIEQSVEDQAEILQKIQQTLEQRRNNSNNNNNSGGEEMDGACHPGNHTTIDDDRRAISGENDGDDICDKHLRPGWYRFLLEGCSATIPTACVPVNHCHTDAPTWVDLQDQDMPEEGQEIQARACSHWDGDCCNWEAGITVRNCGEFYIYKIEPLHVCDLAFCVRPQF